MENFPKRRGRPRKIPESPTAGLFEFPDLDKETREMFGLSRPPTERSRANAYYADGARKVVETYKEQVKDPHNPVLAAKTRLGMDWILARKTVLTELGRMMDEDPTETDIDRFKAVVRHVAERHDKLNAKLACAYVRARRVGDTHKRSDRVASLHHDLNAAINVHRQRYPESTWTDIKRALDLSTSQIERKIPRSA